MVLVYIFILNQFYLEVEEVLDHSLEVVFDFTGYYHEPAPLTLKRLVAPTISNSHITCRLRSISEIIGK